MSSKVESPNARILSRALTRKCECLVIALKKECLVNYE